MNRLTVPDTISGIRLEDFLARTWPAVDRAHFRRLILADGIMVNMMPAKTRQRLVAGDFLEIDGEARSWPRRNPDADAVEVPILFESDLYLVVDKPAGLPSVPDRAGKETGVHGLLSKLRPDDDLRIAHRLDRNTSGCLVLAKGLEAARHLDRVFRDGLVRKDYLALVEGNMRCSTMLIRRALGPDTKRPGKVRVVPEGSAKSRSAETELEVTEAFNRHTLVTLRPKTGRSHQLRVHLSSLGHPIVADRDYGGQHPLLLSQIKRGYKIRRGVVERPLLERMFLHARQIEIPDPSGNGSIVVEAPLPTDLETVLTKMRQFAAPRTETRHAT